jgi:hypothetical protein
LNTIAAPGWLNMDTQKQKYSIWIEAEEWAPGEWTPSDDNSDVIVTFENGERWVATFYSYQNILSLREKNLRTGECLGGRYFCATDMILVDKVSRELIEEVIAEILEQKEFATYFAHCRDDSGDAA